jgi:NAD(P)H dehydrogenase (quinone)
MKILVIVAHPDAQSFNHAIASTVKNTIEQAGHTVDFHDLYAEKFDALIPVNEIQRNADLPELIQQHCDAISEADGIVIIHPNWWGQPPAILKGWIDRIIRPGVAYEFIEDDKGEGVPVGLLKASSVVVINTSNTESNREKYVFGDPLETIWKNCVFGLCGVTEFHRRMYNIVITSTETERKAWLKDASKVINKVYSMKIAEQIDGSDS